MGTELKKRQWQGLILLLVIVVLYTVWQYNGSGAEQDVIAGVDSEKIGIAIGEEEPRAFALEKIRSVQLTEDLDVGDFVSGREEENFCYGMFHNALFGDYTLCRFKNTKELIILETDEGTFAFNLSGSRNTKKIYEDIQLHLQ